MINIIEGVMQGFTAHCKYFVTKFWNVCDKIILIQKIGILSGKWYVLLV